MPPRGFGDLSRSRTMSGHHENEFWNSTVTIIEYWAPQKAAVGCHIQHCFVLFTRRRQQRGHCFSGKQEKDQVDDDHARPPYTTPQVHPRSFIPISSSKTKRPSMSI
mmetsp:Transcript_23903/g.34966  ORF Transcript_23903/g.34966 Transcript_23903/m.34966 type:complete len:107 (+) Transcript_23903:110-430(+)